MDGLIPAMQVGTVRWMARRKTQAHGRLRTVCRTVVMQESLKNFPSDDVCGGYRGLLALLGLARPKSKARFPRQGQMAPQEPESAGVPAAEMPALSGPDDSADSVSNCELMARIGRFELSMRKIRGTPSRANCGRVNCNQSSQDPAELASALGDADFAPIVRYNVSYHSRPRHQPRPGQRRSAAVWDDRDDGSYTAMLQKTTKLAGRGSHARDEDKYPGIPCQLSGGCTINIHPQFSTHTTEAEFKQYIFL